MRKSLGPSESDKAKKQSMIDKKVNPAMFNSEKKAQGPYAILDDDKSIHVSLPKLDESSFQVQQIETQPPDLSPNSLPKLSDVTTFDNNQTTVAGFIDIMN